MVKSRNDIIIELDSHWVLGMFHNYKLILPVWFASCGDRVIDSFLQLS